GATCHDPDKDYSGTRQVTAAGQMNLRRTMALANLAWKQELGWDGRYATLDEQLAAHVVGQLGDPAAATLRLADDATYRAHVTRTSATLLAALRAFVVTRYDGDAPWDREESGPKGKHAAGYALFMGKAPGAAC